MHNTTNFSRLALRLLAVFVLALTASRLNAQEVVFDTITAPIPSLTFWAEPVAQSFNIGGNHTLDSVTLGLERFGNPQGQIEVELWNSVEGQPGSRIGSLGSVSDFDRFPIGPRQEQLISFDTSITGLTPNADYWVVMVSDSSFNSSNGFGWNGGLRLSSLMDIPEAVWQGPLGDANAGPNEDWSLVSSFFNNSPRVMRMSVSAVPEPTGFSLAIIGLAWISLCRRRYR